jgi:hypothetical protein
LPALRLGGVFALNDTVSLHPHALGDALSIPAIPDEEDDLQALVNRQIFSLSILECYR